MFNVEFCHFLYLCWRNFFIIKLFQFHCSTKNISIIQLELEDFGKNLTCYNNGKQKEIQQKILVFQRKINPRIDIETYYHVWFVFISHNIVSYYYFFLDDHSRIVLKNCDRSVPGSDYINANMIKVITYILFLIN